MRRAFDRLFLRSVNRALGQNQQDKPKKVQLKLHNLEAREQAGNMVNGLFAAAAGTAMADPLHAMAAAVGDLAMLTDAPKTASQAKITPSKSTYSATESDQLSSPVSQFHSSRPKAPEDRTSVEIAGEKGRHAFGSGDADSWDLSLDDSKSMKGSDHLPVAGSSGGGSGDTPPLNPSSGSTGGESIYDPVGSEGNNDTSVSPTSGKALSPSALQATAKGKSLSPQSIEQFIATAERDASTLYSTETPDGTAMRSASLVTPQTTETPIFAVGTDAGVTGKVKVYDALTQEEMFTITPFGNSFTGGVRVAVADVTGDGVAEVIAAQGAGGVNRIKIYDINTQAVIAGGNFTAFSTNKSDGVYVAAADVTGDGKADIIVGTDGNFAPKARLFNGSNGNIIRTVDLSADLVGGVRVAAGDVTGDGYADVVVAGGPGSSSRIQILDGTNGAVIQDYFAFDVHSRTGLNIAVGDVNGDGYADIVAGKITSDSWISVFSGKDTSSWKLQVPLTSPSGVRLGTVDSDADGKLDIIVGDGVGGGDVRIYKFYRNELIASEQPFGSEFLSGTFVSGDTRPGSNGFSARLLSDIPVPNATVVALTPDVMESDAYATVRFSIDEIYPVEFDIPVLELAVTIGGTAQGTDYDYVYVVDHVFPVSTMWYYMNQHYMDVNIPLFDDNVFDGDKTLTIQVWPNPNETYYVGTPSIATIRIHDDDGPLATPPNVGGPSPSPSPPDVDDVCESTEANSQASGMGGSGGPTKVNGVRAADGSVNVSSNDLGSGGFGQSYAIERGWTNSNGYDSVTFDGNSVTTSNLPALKTDGTRIVAITGGDKAEYFDPAGGGSFAARDYSQDKLTQNTGAKEFTMVSSGGDKLVFNNFDSSLPANQKGQLKSITDADGNVTSVTNRTMDGKPLEVQRTSTTGGVTTTESFTYTYLSSGTNAGKIADITLERKVGAGSWSTVRKVEYDYYDGTTANGTAGDIKKSVIKDASNNVLDTQYFRYYTSASSTGYAGGMKYVLNADAYKRLETWAAANSTTVDAATDGQVDDFADHYFEYDSVRRVTKTTESATGCTSCSGGQGTTTFSYTTSPFANGYNSWRTKTVATRDDGNSTTVYTNFVGQSILEIFNDVASGQEWCTFYKYDAAGRLILTANPSAVSGYDETKADLLNNVAGNYSYLRDGQGLIYTQSYYSSTTATSSTPGGVNGYLYQTGLQRGETGTSILQSSQNYFSRTDGSITVYPVASQTQYRNTNGTGGQTTSYSYSWYSGTIQAELVTTTLPTVTTGQNGSNSAITTTTAMDDRGRGIWSKDGGGFLTYIQYNDVTGAITKIIRDVDTTQTGTFANLPSGWSTPAGGGSHQTTTYEVDALGRTTKETDPNGNITYYVYNDVDREVRVYAGWDATNNVPTGPTYVTREDRERGYTETLTMSATPNVSSGRPTGTESISDIQTLSRSVLNEAGQVVYSDQYFNLSGVTYSQSSVTLGTSGTNYYRTSYSYDKMGRQAKTVTPSGTIYRTEYDGLNRVVSQWVGTDDTPTTGFWSPSNLTGTDMVKTSENEYDGGNVGDSNLTQSIQFPGGGAADRKTDYYYDWRNRLVATKRGVESSESTSVNRPISYTEFDNLGQSIVSEMYDGDGITLTDSNSDGVPDKPSSSLLRAKSTADYDELGRAYKTSTFSVDQSTGSVSTNALISQSWWNSRGQLIKSSSPGGGVSKSDYDGLRRVTKAYLSDGGGDSGYSDADDVTGDKVLSQAEYAYDANGNVILVASRERFHDENGTGTLGTPSSGNKARVSFSASYYDKANRTTASVDVGTNGGSTYTRPGSVPSRSDTVLVNDYGYNAAGWVETTTDPKGLVSKTYYDNLGRTTKTIENYVNGVVSDSDDKTVEYTYDLNGQMKTLKALLTGGGYQTTEWVYGVTSPIVSNDVLKEVRYPDVSTGNANSSDKESYTYNQLGQTLTKTDRNGSVHTYAYDVLGRQISDTVSTLASGVDGSVRRVEMAYDVQGNAYLVTAYDATTSGSVVNQIQREFNGLGQLITEFQATNGSVNTGSTPKAQYAYSFAPSGSTNHSRLTSITYPNGRVLTYNYASGLDADISRLSSISDGGITLESYDYLGYGTVVRRGHAQSGVDLTYIKQTGESDGAAGDKYTGLDTFGRVIDQRWITSTPTAKDRFTYGYDRDSNRLYKENLLDSTKSELYAYDNLNQITSFDRGTLNGTKTGLTGAASRSQSWDFDAQGNFNSQTTDGTTQTRTHNAQNEITGISSATTPTYDANGNLTKDETGRTFKYDAWNRLVEVKNSGGTTLATYKWDGIGRRVRETRSGTTTDLYYSDQWQVLEERVGGTTRISYAWSPVYVDALIARDRDSDNNGSLDERLYVAQDANFNITALIDTSGNVVERYVYDAFGSFIILTGAWGPRANSNYAWKYLHQGGRWDADGGLYSFRNREYSPTLGRWLQMDPIMFSSGESNLYRAFANRPNSSVDPLGLEVTTATISLREYFREFYYQLYNSSKNIRSDHPIVGAIQGISDQSKLNLVAALYNIITTFGDKNIQITANSTKHCGGCSEFTGEPKISVPGIFGEGNKFKIGGAQFSFEIEFVVAFEKKSNCKNGKGTDDEIEMKIDCKFKAIIAGAPLPISLESALRYTLKCGEGDQVLKPVKKHRVIGGDAKVPIIPELPSDDSKMPKPGDFRF